MYNDTIPAGYNRDMSVRAARASKRDKNEKAILEFIEAAGCVVIQMEPGQGFDLLVIAQNGIHIVEIKNPAYRWELTHDESMMKISVEQVGQAYHICESIQDAGNIIGKDTNNGR